MILKLLTPKQMLRYIFFLQDTLGIPENIFYLKIDKKIVDIFFYLRSPVPSDACPRDLFAAEVTEPCLLVSGI